MANNRDDFTEKTKDRMAKRVGYRCSNPNCRKLTCGAAQKPDDYVNIGVAAHICAAAPGGKRYDKRMTAAARKSIHNGIWLCQSCSKLIDSDELRYPVELLYEWKYDAETESARQLENSAPGNHHLKQALSSAKEETDAIEQIQFLKLLNQEIDALMKMMEEIHQKLEAAKTEEDSIMTQAYKERLQGLMLLHGTMNVRLARLAGETTASKRTNPNLFEMSEQSVNKCEQAAPKKAGRSRGGLMRFVMIAVAAGALGWLADAHPNVLKVLAAIVATLVLGLGIIALRHKEEKPTSINAKVEIPGDKKHDSMIREIEMMQAAVVRLASEVGQLHLDRIQQEKNMAQSCRE